MVLIHKLVSTVICLFLFISLSYPQAVLSGVVTDSEDNQPIGGAELYFSDLKLKNITDSSGRFRIVNLPENYSLNILVTAFGYRKESQSVTILSDTIIRFQLRRKITEKTLEEVVIVNSSQSVAMRRTPIPIATFSLEELRASTSSNIIDVLTQNPAISQSATGPGISKPIVRGLGLNRVVVVHNGIRQEGQQWGDEHGVEIDEYSVNQVELIKGAAGLMYGGDALGGVINMKSATAAPSGSIKGDILLNYQSNNGMIGGSAHLSGNQKGWIWDARYSRKMAHDYKNSVDGYVFNSGFRENSFSGKIGVTKRWGYSHLFLSVYDMTLGIVEGERDSLTGKFVKEIAESDTSESIEIATRRDFLSYRMERNVPYQKIRHYQAVLQNRFLLGRSTLDIDLAGQLNQRKEFEDVHNLSEYGLFLDAQTWNINTNYRLPSIHDWKLSFGLNYGLQLSKNGGNEFLIPDYSQSKGGAFFLVSRTWNRWTLNGGIRYDLRFLHSNPLWNDEVSSLLFDEIRTFQDGVSANLGSTYELSKEVSFKFNLSKGFRPADIAELSSNGVHEGTSTYIVGNAALKAEENIQADFSTGWDSEHITASVDLFYNIIQNFIYLQKRTDGFGNQLLTEDLPTFQYTSGNAQLFGGEVEVDFHPHPLDWLHINNRFGIVEGLQFNQSDSLRFLPFIPAPKWNFEIKAVRKKIGKHLSNSFLKIGIHQTFAKKNIHSAFQTETITPYYALLNVGIGTDVIGKNERKILSLMLGVNNILNTAYQSHLNRLKYLEINPVNGRMGVFNMGRNVSLKVIFPIEIR